MDLVQSLAMGALVVFAVGVYLVVGAICDLAVSLKGIAAAPRGVDTYTLDALRSLSGDIRLLRQKFAPLQSDEWCSARPAFQSYVTGGQRVIESTDDSHIGIHAKRMAEKQAANG